MNFKFLLIVTILLFSLSFIAAETYTFDEEGVVCDVDGDDYSCERMPMISASSSGGPLVFTFISGRVLNEDLSAGVKGADVEIVCTHDGVPTVANVKSFDGGFYFLGFNGSVCAVNDSIVVSAEKDGKAGSVGPMTVQSGFFSCVAFGLYNVPLVPEFGAVVGLLTILSAVGIFFVVRRD